MKSKYILTFTFIFLLVSCNKNTNFIDETKIVKQTLKIENKPKFEYDVSEKINLENLKLVNEIEYVENDKTISTKQDVDTYTSTIDGVSISSFSFPSAGEFKIEFSTTGYKNETLKTYLTIYAYDQQGPNQYTDTFLPTYENYYADISFTNVNNSNIDSTKEYYSPDEIEMPVTNFELGKKSYLTQYFMPSKGNVPMLVVPIVVPDANNEATDDKIVDIKKAFFGKKEEINFESLHSFYYKSSYGQLNIIGNVTPYFDIKTYTKYKTVSSMANDSNNVSNNVAQAALRWAKEVQKIDINKYDLNQDGVIDSMYFVYVGQSSTQNIPFWAFTTSTGKIGTKENPLVNTYSWVGYDFLKQEGLTVSKQDENKDLDAHVIIHETGHMLGLNDYYSYNSSTYSPLGKIDMMDNNVLDHNPYSKMRMGWIKPYIVTSNTSITIPSSQFINSCIVIPYDNKKFTFTDDNKLIFNPFDEYLVLDLYTNENINSYDFKAYEVNHIDGIGIRVYHVNSHLAQVTNNGRSVSFLKDSDYVLNNESKDLFQLISNSEGGQRAESYFLNDSSYNYCDEIRWIDAKNEYIGSKPNSTLKGKTPSSTSLFNIGDSFSFAEYKDSFNFENLDFNEKLSSMFTVSNIYTK